jgi:hypothetical protein
MISVAGCTIGFLCPRCPSSGQRVSASTYDVVSTVAYTPLHTDASERRSDDVQHAKASFAMPPIRSTPQPGSSSGP